MLGRFGAALVAAFLFVVPSAQAMLCGPADELLANLKDRYGETKAASGVTTSGALFVVMVNENTGTWTLVSVDAEGGVVCMLAAGDGWRATLPGQEM